MSGWQSLSHKFETSLRQKSVFLIISIAIVFLFKENLLLPQSKVTVGLQPRARGRVHFETDAREIDNQSHSQPHLQPINLTCISINFRRKLVYQQRTHAGTERPVDSDQEPSCCANHLITASSVSLFSATF